MIKHKLLKAPNGTTDVEAKNEMNSNEPPNGPQSWRRLFLLNFGSSLNLESVHLGA